MPPAPPPPRQLPMMMRLPEKLVQLERNRKTSPPTLIRPADPSTGVGALFLGPATVEGDLLRLRELNITHILQVGTELSPSHPLERDLEYKWVCIDDGCMLDLRRHFAECVKFIADARSAGKSVLVHCYAGVSRSATIVLAYLMHTERLTLAAALDDVRSKRTQVNPNLGFMFQLEDFEAADSDPAHPAPRWDDHVYEARMKQPGVAASAAAAAAAFQATSAAAQAARAAAAAAVVDALSPPLRAAVDAMKASLRYWQEREGGMVGLKQP